MSELKLRGVRKSFGTVRSGDQLAARFDSKSVLLFDGAGKRIR